MAALRDVNGFNQKTENCNGERLIFEGLRMLGKKYSNKVIETLNLMLKFDENERPNFIELERYLARNSEYIPRADLTLIQYLEQKKLNKSNKSLSQSTSNNNFNSKIIIQIHLLQDQMKFQIIKRSKFLINIK